MKEPNNGLGPIGEKTALASGSAQALATRIEHMFVTSDNYKEKLETIVADDGDLLLAVAFWGRGAESIVLSKRRATTKLICNLRSGATNPETISSLRKEEGVVVRQHDRLHAKVILGPKMALVGSANLSSNGLNLEAEETDGWEEAGVIVTESLQLKSIRQWFESLWRDAREVTDNDLEEAISIWASRRGTRIKSRQGDKKNGFTLQGLSESEILDRPVFLAIYNESLSDEAKKAYRKKQQELTGQRMPKSAKLPPMYENWPKLPKNAYLIDLYYGRRGALKCYGAFIREFDIKFKYKDGTNGHLSVCRKENKMLGLHFRTQESAILAKTIKPYIQNIWNSPMAKGDESGKIISLAEAVRLIG